MVTSALQMPLPKSSTSGHAAIGADLSMGGVGQDELVSLLTCPLCGQEQDARGPGVSSHPDDSGTWVHSWTPFIEDLRGTATRLVHPKCFANDYGFEALIALVTDHDQRTRVSEVFRQRR